MTWEQIGQLIALFCACCLAYELVDRGARR
jgi:hypothetical protein